VLQLGLGKGLVMLFFWEKNTVKISKSPRIPATGQDGEMINSLKISGVLQVGIANLLRS